VGSPSFDPITWQQQQHDWAIDQNKAEKLVWGRWIPSDLGDGESGSAREKGVHNASGSDGILAKPSSSHFYLGQYYGPSSGSLSFRQRARGARVAGQFFLHRLLLDFSIENSEELRLWREKEGQVVTDFSPSRHRVRARFVEKGREMLKGFYRPDQVRAGVVTDHYYSVFFTIQFSC
jgi:hypothetical protein